MMTSRIHGESNQHKKLRSGHGNFGT
jgi:hypothetical protein